MPYLPEELENDVFNERFNRTVQEDFVDYEEELPGRGSMLFQPPPAGLL